MSNHSKIWLNLQLLSALSTGVGFFWLAVQTKGHTSPSRQQLELDPSLTCPEPSWLWVDGDEGLMCFGLFMGAVPLLLALFGAQYNARASKGAGMSGVFVCLTSIVIVFCAAVLLSRVFWGSDLAIGGSPCDTWNYPEGDERWKFAVAWGGIMTGALCTIAFTALHVTAKNEPVCQMNKLVQ